MRLKYPWSSQREQLSLGKWSWRAGAAATALVAGVTLTGAGSAAALPATHAKASQAGSLAILNPPAHQMSELNFLLGSFTCTTAAGLTMYEITRPVLDGNYYQMAITLDIPGKGMFGAFWTLGWDPVDLNFIAQYYDNLGITGDSTSVGWQNGHLLFPGRYVNVVSPGGTSGIGKGSVITSEDDFYIVGPGHYIDASYVLQNGQWVSQGANNCQKTS